MKLSLLIPSIAERGHLLERLLRSIDAQKNGYDVETLVLVDSRQRKIGNKRNELLQKASGDYLAFIDDDDRISDDYIQKVFEGIEKCVDCCSLTGIITFDGLKPKPFIHSIQNDRYWEDEWAYMRFPNHLNTIKSSIAKQFYFPETNHGEDTDFATQMHKSGLLKTEHFIDGVIYYYDYISNK